MFVIYGYVWLCMVMYGYTTSLNYYSCIIDKGRGKGGGYERRDNTSESRVCGNISIPTQLMCSMLLMHYYYQIFFMS